jgi:hypothetical protein
VPSFLSKPARLFYRAGLGPGPKSGLRAGLTGLVLFGHLYVKRILAPAHRQSRLSPKLVTFESLTPIEVSIVAGSVTVENPHKTISHVLRQMDLGFRQGLGLLHKLSSSRLHLYVYYLDGPHAQTQRQTSDQLARRDGSFRV